MQMLIDLQSSRAPLQGGERVNITLPSTTPPAATKPAEPAAPTATPQNPFSRALELGKSAVARELHAPTVAEPSSKDAAARTRYAEAELRGERYGDVATPGTEQALRNKIGGEIPLPTALIRYIRENRSTVLLFSLLSLGLVAWLGTRAAQKRN